MVHHDDPAREYAYDDPQILTAAAKNGGTVLSMRQDFADLWPHQSAGEGPRRTPRIERRQRRIPWKLCKFRHGRRVAELLERQDRRPAYRARRLCRADSSGVIALGLIAFGLFGFATPGGRTPDHSAQ